MLCVEAAAVAVVTVTAAMGTMTATPRTCAARSLLACLRACFMAGRWQRRFPGEVRMPA